MDRRDKQSLIAYLAPNIGYSIGGGLMLWLIFALFNMSMMSLFLGWLIGSLLVIGYRLFGFYRA